MTDPNPSFSIQDRYCPSGVCFGCGPANKMGLQIKSFPSSGDSNGDVIATFESKQHHEAWPGVVSGGILGTLIDCHSAWTAAWHFKVRDGLERAPVPVTASFTTELLSPTPSDAPVSIAASVVESSRSSAIVDAIVSSSGVVTARGRGTFVAVKEGHPAYHGMCGTDR